MTVPWLAATTIGAMLGLIRLFENMQTLRDGPWRVGLTAAFGFLAVGAGWLFADRVGLRPFGFGSTIVLLTAVHFHVAGFLLTLAGVLAWRAGPSRWLGLAIAAFVGGTPLTALGFFGFPVINWIGALLVAVGGIGIGIGTIATSASARPAARGLLLLAGGSLLVSMPMAAIYATGTTFRIAGLDIPVMAAVHGGLNVVGFALPPTIGWSVRRRDAG